MLPSPCLARHSLRGALPPFRTVRPSLMDLRFTGDPWVVGRGDGGACLCLDGYQLATLSAPLLRFAFPEPDVVPFAPAARQTVRASSESCMNPFVLSATRRGATSRFRASRWPGAKNEAGSKPLRQYVS